MKTTKERIENLLDLRDKKEIANEVNDLLLDLIASATGSIEKEFLVKTENDSKTIASVFFVTPPAMEEKIIIKEDVYRVESIVHSSSSKYPSFIIVTPTTEKSSKYYEDFI